jgi:outer membrane protein TolC
MRVACVISIVALLQLKTLAGLCLCGWKGYKGKTFAHCPTLLDYTTRDYTARIAVTPFMRLATCSPFCQSKAVEKRCIDVILKNFKIMCLHPLSFYKTVTGEVQIMKLYMNRFYLVFTLALICCFPASWLWAGAMSDLSIVEAYKKALESSPVMHRARAASEQADAEVDRAISAFLPKVDLELGYSHSNKPPKVFSDKLNQQEFSPEDFEIERLNDPGYRDNWGARVIFTQPLFNQGREYIGYLMADTGKELASIRLDGTIQRLLYMVEKAFCEVLLAKENVDVLQQALKTAKNNELLADSRHKTGMALRSDVLNAQVHRTETERELIQAENEYKIAMAALNRVMGTPMDIEWNLVEDDMELAVEDSRPLSYWLELARHNRAELLGARKEVELAEYRSKQAYFSYLPSLNLQAIYDTNRNNLAYFGGDDWTIMASASFNIFNGLGDRAAVASATAAEKEARAAAREKEAGVELEVRKAFYNLQKAEKQLDVMKRSVARAAESLRILSRRYNNGLALMVELLSADTILREEKLRETKARFDVRLAIAGLKWSAGAFRQTNTPLSVSRNGDTAP